MLRCQCSRLLSLTALAVQVEYFVQRQRGGRLDLAADGLRELLVSVVMCGGIQAAIVLAQAHSGGPEGDYPFTAVDGMHILHSIPQHVDVDPLIGAQLVDRSGFRSFSAIFDRKMQKLPLFFEHLNKK